MELSINVHNTDTLNLSNNNECQNEEVCIDKFNFNKKLPPVLIDAEQSSFEETLDVVSNKDNPDILCLTFRSCLIGLIFNILLSSVNSYFYYRTKTYPFPSVIAILLAYPIGKFLSLILPKQQWFKNRWYSFSLNPGPFTIKEHTLIYTMAYIGAQNVVSCDLFVTMKIKQTNDTPKVPHYLIGLIYVLSIQLLGYSLAGILRRILVWPSEMIWLWNFPYMVTLRTMNEKESSLSSRWLGLTRRYFFIIIFLFAFIYHWLPNFIFPMLNYFPWWCLINQNSTILSQLTGSAGLAIGLIPLNWNRYLYPYMTPLVQPWWAYANMIFGFIIIGWVIIPILYYLNVLNWSQLPIIGNNLYISPNDKNNIQYPVGTAIVTYLYFGVMLSLFVHTFLYHGRDIIKYLRTSLKNRQNDVHCTLISQYKEASDWIYGIIFLITFIISCLICHFTHLMPWYYIFVAVSLSTSLIIPTSIVQAQAGLYIRSDLVLYILGGAIFHNRPMSNNTFFSITYGILTQAMFLLQNFKLAHYIKISPRTLFIIQLISSIISSTIAYIITRYLLSYEKDFCLRGDWKCYRTSFDAYYYANQDLSMIFGLNSVYPWLLWMMIAIGVLPIFVWIAQRLFLNIKWLKSIHVPVMFMYLISLSSPENGYLSFPSWLLLGVIFRKLIRRWWFDRYAFLFQMGMIMGTFVNAFFMFFIFTYNDIKFPDWWGTQTNICPLAYANVDGKILEN